jgi:hypothetical protein
MNKRQVVVLWIAAIVLLTAAIVVRSGSSKGFESKTERARGQTVLADFDPKQVARIRVSSGENVATLVRKDGQWSVEERGNYPANLATVNDFLRTLTEVEVTEGVEAEPKFAPRFGMDPSASEEEERGTEVVLSDDAGNELAHLTVGKSLQAAGSDPMAMMMGGGSTGRFLRNHADASGVYKVSEMFSTLSPEPARWLEDDFVKVEKIKSIAVSPPEKPEEVAWKVSRADENAEFALEGAKPGESLDSTAAAPLKTLLSYARFDDVVPADKVEAMAKPGEKKTVKVETFEGFVYTLGLTPVKPEEKEKKEGEEEAPPADEFYLMTVDVEATLPAERKKEEKETEDDAKAKDKAFTERKEALEKQLADEKKLAGRVFKVSKYTVDAVLKERAGLVKTEAQPAPGGAAAPGAPAGAAIGGAVTPPVQVPPRRPVEAVTPPIAIPPLEETEEAPAEEKPAGEPPAEEKPAEEAPAESQE